jgi:hypothetical protein
MGNENRVIGSADACLNIEGPGRCVNCGVVRLRGIDCMCVEPMRRSEAFESRVSIHETGSCHVVCAERDLMARVRPKLEATPEANNLALPGSNYRIHRCW